MISSARWRATWPRPSRARREEEHEYWNGGYALLAGIIETASGLSYQDYCRARLFERAGLEATGFTGDTHFPEERLATGYDGERALRPATGHPYRDYGYQYRGMGGVVTCAADLRRFARALDAGVVLSSESVAEMQSPVTEYYGLGWSTTSGPRGLRCVGHGGDVAGFHTQWQRFPDEDAQVIVLSNVDGIPMFKIAASLAAILFGEALSYPPHPEAFPTTDRELDLLVGRFGAEEGSALNVRRAGDDLEVQVEGSDPRLEVSTGIPEDLRVHADRAREILDWVRASDHEALGEILGPRIPSSWPRLLTTRVWPQHLKRWGPLQDVRPVTVDAAGRRGITVLFRLEHERAVRPLTITRREDALVGLDLSGPLDDVAGRYVRVEDGSFVSFDWNSPTLGTLRFEESARSVWVAGSGAPPRKLTRLD